MEDDKVILDKIKKIDRMESMKFYWVAFIIFILIPHIYKGFMGTPMTETMVVNFTGAYDIMLIVKIVSEWVMYYDYLRRYYPNEFVRQDFRGKPSLFTPFGEIRAVNRGEEITNSTNEYEDYLVSFVDAYFDKFPKCVIFAFVSTVLVVLNGFLMSGK